MSERLFRMLNSAKKCVTFSPAKVLVFECFSRVLSPILLHLILCIFITSPRLTTIRQALLS